MKLFQKLKNDENSTLFGEDDPTNNIIKELKKSNNKQDKEFVNLILDLENRYDLFRDENVHIPSKTEFVEQKREINKSSLYSFDGPFQLLNADVANLKFLGKSAVDLQYCLLFVNLFTSKVYT